MYQPTHRRDVPVRLTKMTPRLSMNNETHEYSYVDNIPKVITCNIVSNLELCTNSKHEDVGESQLVCIDRRGRARLGRPGAWRSELDHEFRECKKRGRLVSSLKASCLMVKLLILHARVAGLCTANLIRGCWQQTLTRQTPFQRPPLLACCVRTARADVHCIGPRYTRTCITYIARSPI